MSTNTPLLLRTNEVLHQYLNATVVINGWIKKIVKVGSFAFLTLSDSFGHCQLVASRQNTLLWQQVMKLTKESVVQIQGTIQQKVNIALVATATFEVVLSKIKIINLAKTTPFLIKDQTDALEKLRLQYRYLDLRRPQMHRYLQLRYRLYQVIRDFFAQQKIFIEVETPILAQPTIEGAQNFTVTSQIQKKQIFALPQSPQIYKQLLMNAGIAGYFQFPRCFRDEDLRNDRQPEFTQLDLEVNFADQSTIIRYVEKLCAQIYQKIKNITISHPFVQIDYQTACNKYGTDAPDLRYQLCLEEYPHLQSSPDDNKVLKGIMFPSAISASDWKKIQTEIQKITKAPLLFYFQQPSLRTNLTIFQQQNLLQHRPNHESLNWIGFNASLQEVNLVLGKVRIHLGQILHLINPDTFVFCWIVDQPLFQFSVQEQKYVATHHPFCQPSSVEQFWNDWKQSRAIAYDLVCNGVELGSGSERIYDFAIQKKVFQILGLDDATINKEFGYFLAAMQYGFPNHAGFALGLDRLLMILTNAESIRDVIAFPKTSKLTSLLTSSKPV